LAGHYEENGIQRRITVQNAQTILQRRSSMKKNNVIPAIILVLALGISGCATSNAFRGGAIGAAGGGVIGAIIGNQAGSTAIGAIIGAAVGGTAGALIGASMDRQAAEMEKDLEGAKIERVGEGIKITFDSGLLFSSGSSGLQSKANTNLKKLAVILNKYPDTNVLVEGHTDSDGSEEFNQKLSERRANAVGNQLKSQGVISKRFTIMGYGETQPVADNESDYGKSQNRRVDLAIFANDKLKNAAKQKAAKEEKQKQQK
jgi:outer membrane protein OmpA-like peptidoglycan-associated protein